MRQFKEESYFNVTQAIDIMSAVKELNNLSSQELSKLLRDSENFAIHYSSESNMQMTIDVEKLACFLPLHLMAVLMSSDRDEALFKYLLCGVRLLHSLCDLAPRHAKLEQILLDDVKMSEQLLDLVFYMLIVLGGFKQENYQSDAISVAHSSLVACSLYLLTGCISSQWQDLVHVLIAHPKVDIFMEAAFASVFQSVKVLDLRLSAENSDSTCTVPIAELINYLCLQCEASLQFLQTLCQQKVFRERLLRNKELCCKGGVLFLARAILNLNVVQHHLQSSRVSATLSRLKAKVLSILLSLCEAESISYLDEVASTPRSLDFAKSVALQVLELLKNALSRDSKSLASCSEKRYPIGFLQLNAMRLADIFSDDSNFRSYITVNFTKVLTAVFSLSHGDFLSSWCSSDLPVKEEDATLEYDSFAAAGWVLDNFFSLGILHPKNLDFTLIPSTMAPASYAHQRTSLFVKVIANLHCFVPTICEEQERNLFLHGFVDCLKMDIVKLLPGLSVTPDGSKAANVCRNLRSLLSQAESLIPNFLNEEDVQLLRVFYDQLQKAITCSEIEGNRVQDALSVEGCLPSLGKELPHHDNENGNMKEEGMSETSACQETENCAETERGDQGDAVLNGLKTKDEDESDRKASGGPKGDERDIQTVETSGSDTNSARGRNSIQPMDIVDSSKSNENAKEIEQSGNLEEEKVENVHSEEKHRRKRKRTVMNDKQITIIESALLDEPEMQRNPALIQFWADELVRYGSEVTSAQLKNWLNNRKARLARTARDIRATLEADSANSDKQGGPTAGSCDSPDSPCEDKQHVPNTGRDRRMTSRTNTANNSKNSTTEFDIGPTEFAHCKPGRYVMLVDVLGEEVARGKVHQVHGKWYGRNLEELETFVVDVDELKADKNTVLPYPSDATGTSFHEAEVKIGVMRVLWDSNKIFIRSHNEG
ncbi:nodulin homeobox [Cucurbita maxima]|uniref:Nodulin homeobox n=1 Tax=Cucurbita maxima TaxID=3661 RepID=A0A6J1K739_CUCMA|nr:nodulin homeobox [Cucurbita maxima]